MGSRVLDYLSNSGNDKELLRGLKYAFFVSALCLLAGVRASIKGD